jgi:hypothetical protein
VITIAVTLDCHTAIVFALNNDINPEISYPDLGIDAVASLTQEVEKLSFKIRFTAASSIRKIRALGRIGAAEMLEQFPSKLVAGPKLVDVQRSDKICPIAGTRQRYVEPLLIA